MNNDTKLRTCKVCKVTKGPEGFYDRHLTCRPCLSKVRARYYRLHHPQIRRMTRAWKEANPEEARRLRRAWVKKNRAHRTAYYRDWYRRNRRTRSAAVRAASERWSLANPEKVKTHKLVQAAVAKGELLKPDRCEQCFLALRLVGHHEDYSRPLDVRWLCGSCHKLAHSRISVDSTATSSDD